MSKINHIESLILLTYHKMAPTWIRQCTLEELNVLFEGIMEKHWEYQQISECLSVQE